MILSLRPDAWDTILDGLDQAEWSYRDAQCIEKADEIRELVKSLRELGQQTLSGRLQGYRIPGALGKSGYDIRIEVVTPK